MKGGPQTEGDEGAQAADKVVRLPRDWLGPREDLVPFGPRASAPETDAPPSAADFWGERSAAIHGALEAPAEERIEVGAGESGDVAAPSRRRVFAALSRQQVAAVTAVAVVAAAALSVASGVLAPSGSPPGDAGTARLNMAAVLSQGVSRTVQRGLELLDASAGRAPVSRAARRRAPAIRRTPRPRQVFKPEHESAHSHPIASASSARPESPAAVTAAPRTREVSSPPSQTHTSHSSSASVSPTGESGALGPIQSPNG